MPDFGFVGPAYEAASITQDAQECINWVPEIDPLKNAGERGVVALYPTPGLTLKTVFQNTQEVRGLRTVSGGNYLIAVVGPYVYALTSTYTPTMVGQLSTLHGRVGISDNGVNVYIVDGLDRYTWRISSPSSAVFTASVTSTTLTVTSMTNGTIAVGQSLFGPGIAEGTIITALGTGTGGTGTYTLNITNSTVSEVMNTTNPAATLNAQIIGSTLYVNTASGTIYLGQTIQGTGVAAQTVVTAFGTGTGGVGTYTVSQTQTVPSLAATYTASISGTTLTVSAVASGTVAVGQYVYGANVLGGTLITGGSGSSFTVNKTQTVASQTMYGSIGRTMYAENFTVLPDSDGAFSAANTVDIVDNYFVYDRPDSQQWGASNLLSPISSPLSFASKDGAPDNLVSLIVDHREVYLLGEKSSEVWVDVGAAQFPFQRIPGTSTQHGIASKFSMARLGNSFAYVSRNDRGQAQIVQMNGYVPQRISTHAVENTLANQIISDAYAWTYQLEGHEVYVVTFPSIGDFGLTWAYDISTGMWHKWLYFNNEGQYERHRGACSAVFQGKVIVGDHSNGSLYYLDKTNYTDNGQYTRRLRRAPHLVTDLQRQYFDELQIQFQPGVGFTGLSIIKNNYIGENVIINPEQIFIVGPNDYFYIGQTQTINAQTPTTTPQAMLRWSNDGGSTWSKEYWVGIGQTGRYKNRAIWRRLGMARDRIFEVVVTDPVKAVIVSANLKASQGDN